MMKIIGLLGGMSWESTAVYYQRINECVRDKLGELHSAQILLRSVDFSEIELMQRDARWQEAGQVLAQYAAQLEAGGADFVVLCTNTMHKVVDHIEEKLSIPLLHITDVCGEAIAAQGIQKIGLLGTRFTMEEPFYRERLLEKFQIVTCTPDEPERAAINRIIYDELCLGRIKDDSRRIFTEVGQSLLAAGAEGLVLGCTEIGLLLNEKSFAAPFFDTTELHVQAAVSESLQSIE